jgi:uncharacterized tellurite resistance protein B-like protein
MGLFDFLGLGKQAAAATAEQAGAVHAIAGKLEALEPRTARFVAAFAYLLGRVAHADLAVSADETRRMESLVMERSGLGADLAALVVEIGKGQNRLFGGTENFLVAREFREISTAEERINLLRCLFEVAAADQAISTAEDTQVRLVADELGISREEFVRVRGEYSHQREILRGLPRPS